MKSDRVGKKKRIKQKLANFPYKDKDQRVNILGITEHTFSVVTTQLHVCSSK